MYSNSSKPSTRQTNPNNSNIKTKSKSSKSNSSTMVARNDMSNNTTTYAATSHGAVKRIRTPHPHDVLSGRGGGINSHVGNKTFRDWVRERKEDYNLAGSKAEKARVANEVIALVKSLNPPGRFLQRDPTSSGGSWWIEVDEAKAIAKTSQALREGAPQIRAAHKDELDARTKTNRRKRSSHSSSASAKNTVIAPIQPAVVAPSVSSSVPAAVPVPVPTPAPPVLSPQPMTLPPPSPISSRKRASRMQIARPLSSPEHAIAELAANANEAAKQATNDRPLIAPLTSNKDFEREYRPVKRVRVDESSFNNSNIIGTPPLLPAPATEEIPPLPAHAPLQRNRDTSNNGSSSGKLIRSHSLALSDISTDISLGDEEFVNPFTDENELVNILELLPSTNNNNENNQTTNVQQMETNSTSQARDQHETERDSTIQQDQVRTPSLTSSANEPTRQDRTNSIRSISDLPDLPVTSYISVESPDFDEGMKIVHDAAHPELTSPDKGDWIPTHLIPWRGGLTRRSSSISPRTPRGMDGRQ